MLESREMKLYLDRQKFFQVASLFIIILLIKSNTATAYGLSGNYLDTGGSTLSFGGYANKVLIVDATASWCTSCDPQLIQLQEVFDIIDTKVAILTLSVDTSDTPAKMIELKGRFSSPWTFGIDKNADFQNAYPVSVLPTLHIFDLNGNFDSKYEGITSANTIMTRVNSILGSEPVDQEEFVPFQVPEATAVEQSSAIGDLLSNKLFVFSVPLILIMIALKFMTPAPKIVPSDGNAAPIKSKPSSKSNPSPSVTNDKIKMAKTKSKKKPGKKGKIRSARHSRRY